MSDEFLHQQRPPRRAFADALARQLKAIEETDTMIAANGHVKYDLTPRTGDDTNVGAQYIAPLRTPHLRNWVRLAALIVVCVAVVALYTSLIAPRPPQVATLVQLDTQLLPTDLQPITADNIEQLQVVATLGEGILADADWSPDGATIAAAGAHGIWLMDAQDPTSKRLISTGEDVGLSSLHYNADGSKIAVGAYDGTVYIFDVATERIEMTVTPPQPDYGVQQVAWAGDSKLVIHYLRFYTNARGATFSASLWLYDLEVEMWAVLEDDLQHIGTRFAITRDGSRLAYAIGDVDGATIMLMRLPGRGVQRMGGFYTNGVQALAFSRDNTTLYVAHEFGIDRWDVRNRFLGDDVLPRGSGVFTRYLMEAPGGRTLVAADTNTTLTIYDLESRDIIHETESNRYSGFPIGLDFDPDGSQFFMAATNGFNFTTSTGDPLETFVTHQNGVTALALDANGDTLAALEWGELQPPRLWDLTTGDNRLIEFERDPADFYYGASSTDISSDGTRLLTQTDNFVRLIDTTTDEVIWSYGLELGAGVAFTGDDTAAIVFDKGRNEIVRYPIAASAEPTIVTADNQLQAGAVWGDYAAWSVYQVSGGMTVVVQEAVVPAAVTPASLTLGYQEADALAFSRDGRWLAIASSTVGTLPNVEAFVRLTLWDWRSEEQQTLEVAELQNVGEIEHLALNDNGSLVFALSQYDGILRIIDTATGDLRVEIDSGNYGWSLATMAFSEDERLFITSGFDGLVRVWGVRP
jgi:WD40 repeat protein